MKAPLDDLWMSTTAFSENDQRENLNLVDEASALRKIRDILSARLGREATPKEVAETVGKQDGMRSADRVADGHQRAVYSSAV